MRLYHGSNVLIDKVDFSKCHPYKDFGRGFYLTDNVIHARNMAYRRSLRMGGEACVTEFEFDLDAACLNLNVKIFDRPSEEWAKFVMMNREMTRSHPAHEYDLVIGPIADDSVVASFRLFQDGFISISELVKRLEFKELSIQYFFHNSKALKFLTYIT